MSPTDPESLVSKLVLRRAQLEEILPLRQAVIIAGTNRTSPEFPGDRDPATHHFGAFYDSRNVACATFLLNSWQEQPAWQLRGMATAADLQGRGIGAALLDFAEKYMLSNAGARLLWCNARVRSVPFYVKHGWIAASDVFEIPGVGPHRKLYKQLG